MYARFAAGSRGQVLLRRAAWASVPLVAVYCVVPAQRRVHHHSSDGRSSSSTRPTTERHFPIASVSEDEPARDTGLFASLRGKLQQSPESTEDGSKKAQWAAFSAKFSSAGDAVTSYDWAGLPDRITGLMVPAWAHAVPAYIRKLQSELTWRPGSLADEMLQESADASINPEIGWTAQVRTGTELCAEERAFQQRRRQRVVGALARYLDIPEADIHPDDVPTIAMCGSGGGLRALVAGASSMQCAQQAGLFDCVMYTAGVSGSCWMQALFHSSVGRQDFGALLSHLKKRLGVHIAFPPPALNLLSTAPTHKFLLSGLLEKSEADPKADFGLVDIYGLLLAARLLVPRGELEVDAQDLKISNQRRNTDDGRFPLPIYTAVRHEISPDAPETAMTSAKSTKQDSGHPSEDSQHPSVAASPSWFQWFEWTPYEFWCEEIAAGIPTWSVGRMFEGGASVPRDNGFERPELRLTLLLGVWGSAFCATLSHYYAEIRPLVKGLAGFGGIDDLIEERDADLSKVHPFDPATIPNFARGLDSRLPAHAPASMRTDEHLQLMDAGMSNNLPIYPLLRPGRDVDILVAFDASADPKHDNWLAHADGYARQRGIAGWPMGAGWPPEGYTAAEAAEDLSAKDAASAAEVAAQLPAKTTATETETKDVNTQPKTNSSLEQAPPTPKPTQTADSAPNSPSDSSAGDSSSDLGPCTIWLGSTAERTRRIDAKAASSTNWEALPPETGLAVVYFPLIPNKAVPGVDPASTPFLSTWNFVYTPEDVDAVGQLARANWDAGAAQTQRCVRAVYERKRRERLAREEEAKGKAGVRVWEDRWRDGDVLV